MGPHRALCRTAEVGDSAPASAREAGWPRQAEQAGYSTPPTTGSKASGQIGMTVKPGAGKSAGLLPFAFDEDTDTCEDIAGPIGPRTPYRHIGQEGPKPAPAS
jgi:hypothetical protein